MTNSAQISGRSTIKGVRSGFALNMLVVNLGDLIKQKCRFFHDFAKKKIKKRFPWNSGF